MKPNATRVAQLDAGAEPRLPAHQRVVVLTGLSAVGARSGMRAEGLPETGPLFGYFSPCGAKKSLA